MHCIMANFVSREKCCCFVGIQNVQFSYENVWYFAELTVLRPTESNKILCFTCSLCVSDLLFCLTVLPFAVSRFVHGDWVHNEFLCSMVPMLRYGNVGVSLLSIAMISVNRYLLIAWPQLYPKVYTKCKVAIFVILCWAISYVLMIPTLLGVWGTFGYDEKLRTCSINEDEHGRSSKSTFFSVGFALPCIIIVVCYTRIYWVVRK